MKDDVFDKIHEVDLKERMETFYIDYAMSVIAARALPDVTGLTERAPVLWAIPWVNTIPTGTAPSTALW